MFESIKQLWRESGEIKLKKEFCDLQNHLTLLAPEVLVLAYASFADNYNNILSQRGPLSNISTEGKKKIVSFCRSEARKNFDYNMGASYGLALLGIYVESLTLSGDDAQYVRILTQDILDLALNTRDLLYDIVQ